ncbi:MAG: hypothetical protein H7A35_10955 [Planctomycetales bacterium]|nr:hypothetical protein [bacterium]UNM07387.1 MAG: hypothetical protein H7A35_10955 [Planctomycetales bacterium]
MRREINRQEYEEMSSQLQVRQHGKVTVLTEDEFWSEIRQFKVRQLMNWHEELRLRRWHTEGLYAVTEEYEDQLAQIQKIQELELAELMTEQLVDNTQRINTIEHRLLGIVVWMLILLGLQVAILLKFGSQIF